MCGWFWETNPNPTKTSRRRLRTSTQRSHLLYLTTPFQYFWTSCVVEQITVHADSVIRLNKRQEPPQRDVQNLLLLFPHTDSSVNERRCTHPSFRGRRRCRSRTTDQRQSPWDTKEDALLKTRVCEQRRRRGAGVSQRWCEPLRTWNQNLLNFWFSR